jgi:hypothetical protein
VLLTLRARRDNGFATVWDLASGTRVVVKPKGPVRGTIEPAVEPEPRAGDAESFGPYRIIEEIVPHEWIAATDPDLRRRVWLIRRTESEPAPARRNLARSGRVRWLQKVEAAEATWDAFEAVPGTPFSRLIEGGRRIPWETLRHWLHDLASEVWAATKDATLPAALSLDHVWVTAKGQALLLDRPWPKVEAPAERIPVGDLAGQQRFLNAVAARVETTGLPLHARPMLKNLEAGRFEKLSFFTGTLRGLLDKPAEVSRGIRAGSIFMLPLYVWIMVFVGSYQGAEWLHAMVGPSWESIAVSTALAVLALFALGELLSLPSRTTAGHAIFRLAVVNAEGERASLTNLVVRWAIVWLPLLIPMAFVARLFATARATALVVALVALVLWISAAAYAVVHPHRGLHDRLAHTRVVRR